MSFETQKTAFLEKLLASDAIDPEGVHHEFSQEPGLHGQKVDFDTIETGSELFRLWIDLVAAAIDEFYPAPPDAIVSVANGGNRIIKPVSRRVASKPEPFETVKTRGQLPVLSEIARKAIQLANPGFVLVVEDVSTTGRNAFAAVRAVKEATDADRVEVLNTFQRTPELTILRANNISYHSIIMHMLATYAPDECRRKGHCAEGSELIRYNV